MLCGCSCLADGSFGWMPDKEAHPLTLMKHQSSSWVMIVCSPVLSAEGMC